MKKIICSIILINATFVMGMSKDPTAVSQELILDNNAKFTPQVLKLFGVHEALLHAYKSKKNREDLRFLAFRLYYLKFNFETNNDTSDTKTHNSIPHDQVSYIQPWTNGVSPNIEAITQYAWSNICPKIMSVASREDWTPEFTQNIVNNFWNIYLQESNSPERKKQKEKYEIRKKEEDERSKLLKQGKLKKPKVPKKEKQ